MIIMADDDPIELEVEDRRARVDAVGPVAAMNLGIHRGLLAGGAATAS